MNATQVGGIARSLVIFLGAVAATMGWMQGADWTSLAGLAASGAMLLWSLHTNKTASMIAAVAATPDVHQVIVASPALALAIPNAKVVSK